jgi:excisionase family DNA binding protein
MLSIQQITAATGWGTGVIRGLIREGKLPAYRLGHRIRIAESDLLAIIERVGTSDPDVS